MNITCLELVYIGQENGAQAILFGLRDAELLDLLPTKTRHDDEIGGGIWSKWCV